MLKGSITVVLAMVVVFIAAFTLFFIFDSLNKLAAKCQAGQAPQTICKGFTGFTFNILVVLLLIGGFVLIISSTVFILIR